MASHWNLFWELARCEFKLRDQGTLLGFLWTLLYPALMFLVLYQLFLKWMGRFIPDFATYLLIGLVQWQLFSAGTTQGLSSLLRKAPILRTFSFPREVAVLSSVATVIYSYFFELLVLLGAVVALGHRPSWNWLCGIPLLVLCEVLWIYGFAFALAPLMVRYRDLNQIWSILVTAGFYLTPIFYTLDVVDPKIRTWLLLSPLTRIIMGFRELLMERTLLGLGEVAVLFLAGLAFLGVGLYLFRIQIDSAMDRL